MKSVKIITHEAMASGSLENIKNKIEGATTALNRLLLFEQDSAKQKEIRGEIVAVEGYGKLAEHLFQLNEALKEDPSLKNLVLNKDFVKDFEILFSVFGLSRNMDSSMIKSFAKMWQNEGLRSEFKDFIRTAYNVRIESLNILKGNQFPGIRQKAMQLTNTLNDFLPKCYELLPKSEALLIKGLMNHIINDRLIVSNTQLNEDGLYLAFNSDSTHTLADRQTKAKKASAENYENKKEQLNKELIEAKNNNDLEKRRSIERELLKIEQLKGYKPRGMLLDRSDWVPSISSTDSIKPIERIIGVATVEGKKNESRISLDFTKVFGNDFFPTESERVLLSELLIECDKSFTQNAGNFNLKTLQAIPANDLFPSENVDNSPAESALPENIKGVIDQFDSENCPRLKTLTADEKKALIMESLRFAIEVNLAIAKNLLTLT